MEGVYLLASIFSTFFTSLILSLLLPFRWFLRRLFSSTAAGSGSDSVTLYEGIVWHQRRRPVLHSFTYAVRYALIDLDRSNSPPSNHLSADDARRIAGTSGPVFYLTIPNSVGYEQNPLSLYYCYETEGSEKYLKKCIAEVTNTPWGERVSFVFNPNSDLVAKPLHVSPFMDMHGNWSIKASAPGDYLYVAISVQHPELGDYFSATLKVKRVPPSLGSDHSAFFYLMPHKVAIWIYWHKFALLILEAPHWPVDCSTWIQWRNGDINWECLQDYKLMSQAGLVPRTLREAFPQNSSLRSTASSLEYSNAFKLWWKGVQFLQHPRYTNPSYRTDATVRDQQLQCCKGIKSNQNINQQLETQNEARQFIWTNANWPWA